jgi:hypothetical protein
VVFTGTSISHQSGPDIRQGKAGGRRPCLSGQRSESEGHRGSPPGPVPPKDAGGEKCRSKKESLQLRSELVENSLTLPDRRKAIIYFGSIMPWEEDAAGDVCGTAWVWRDIFALAAQGHVTINPVNTAGLDGGGRGYLTIAGETGGHAIVGTNDFMPGLRQVLIENSSYYLLAYQPTNDLADGTFRRITVTVKGRPDVEVITRRNYWAPRTKATDEPAIPPTPQQAAMAGILPSSKLALRATAAPFVLPGAEGAVVAFAIGIKQPAFAGRTAEQVDVLLKAFSADGDPKGSDDQTIPITVPAPPPNQDASRYEVLSRIDLPKPGKY